MKTVDLTTNPLTIDQLLESARDESVVVRSADGVTFVVSASTDEADTEIELLRRNHKFLAMLDSFKNDRTRTPLADVEERLR